MNRFSMMNISLTAKTIINKQILSIIITFDFLFAIIVFALFTHNRINLSPKSAHRDIHKEKQTYCGVK